MRMNRLNEMEQYILKHGTASLPELANQFDVSTNTIRRDISALMSRGRVSKVYGGVSANEMVEPLWRLETIGRTGS